MKIKEIILKALLLIIILLGICYGTAILDHIWPAPHHHDHVEIFNKLFEEHTIHDHIVFVYPEPNDPVINTDILYRAICTEEGSKDANIRSLAIQDIVDAGYDIDAMNAKDKTKAYADIWIARKGYDDTVNNRAMIHRDGPNGPVNGPHPEYGAKIVRLYNLFFKECNNEY